MAEMVQVPRPGPDSVVIAAIDEDGATAYVHMSKRYFTEVSMDSLLTRLHESQRSLRDG